MTTFLTILFTLIILIIWFLILYKITTRTRLLIFPAIAVFIASFCLYFYGFWITQSHDEIVPMIINSAIDAILLFIGSNGFWIYTYPEVNISEVHKLIYNYCLNLCLAMSVSVSISFVVSAFGTRIKARIRAASINGKEDLHIFYGITSRAIQLARSIDEKSNEKDKIIFVDTPEAYSIDQETSLTFYDILSSFLTISPKAHRIIDRTTKWILSIPKSGKIKNLEDTKITNLFHAVSLTVRNGKNVTFYVMTDDPEQNAQLTYNLGTEIQSIITGEKYPSTENSINSTRLGHSIKKLLLKLPLIKSKELNEGNNSPDGREIRTSLYTIIKPLSNKFPKLVQIINTLLFKLSFLSPEDLIDFDHFCFKIDEDKPTIYAIIKRNGPYKNIDIQFPEVDIISLDPSYLSVQLLKKGINNRRPDDSLVHPIDFMDIAKDDQDNNLGYVTSQFSSMVIGFGSTGSYVLQYLYEFAAVPDEDGKQARFKCYVVDDRLDYLESNYTINRPSVDFSSKISFQDIKPDSNDFWTFIKDKIDELNFIAICLGDDSRQLKLATDIIKYAHIRRKNGLQNFVVLVPLDREDNSLIIDAIKSFNHRYHSIIHGDVLIPFGERKDIFCYDLINDLKERKKAERIFNYENSILRKYENDIPVEDTTSPPKYRDWTDRHLVWRKICKKPIDTPATMNDPKAMGDYWKLYSAVRLNENQDISSSYFIHTIKKLSKRVDNEKISSEVRDRLVYCAHLRRKAYLEMAGYRFGEKDDYVEMRSRELTEWRDLPKNLHELYNASVDAFLKDE